MRKSAFRRLVNFPLFCSHEAPLVRFEGFKSFGFRDSPVGGGCSVASTMLPLNTGMFPRAYTSHGLLTQVTCVAGVLTLSGRAAEKPSPGPNIMVLRGVCSSHFTLLPHCLKCTTFKMPLVKHRQDLETRIQYGSFWNPGLLLQAFLSNQQDSMLTQLFQSGIAGPLG